MSAVRLKLNPEGAASDELGNLLDKGDAVYANFEVAAQPSPGSVEVIGSSILSAGLIDGQRREAHASVLKWTTTFLNLNTAKTFGIGAHAARDCYAHFLTAPGRHSLIQSCSSFPSYSNDTPQVLL